MLATVAGSHCANVALPSESKTTPRCMRACSPLRSAHVYYTESQEASTTVTHFRCLITLVQVCLRASCLFCLLVNCVLFLLSSHRPPSFIVWFRNEATFSCVLSSVSLLLFYLCVCICILFTFSLLSQTGEITIIQGYSFI